MVKYLSPDLYRDIFYNDPDAKLVIKVVRNDEDVVSDYIILNANDAFEKSMGTTRAEIVNQPISQLNPSTEKVWFKILDDILDPDKPNHHRQHIKLFEFRYLFQGYLLEEDFIVLEFIEISDVYNPGDDI